MTPPLFGKRREPAEQAVLDALTEHGPLTRRGLAHATGYSARSMYRPIANLRDEGLIEVVEVRSRQQVWAHVVQGNAQEDEEGDEGCTWSSDPTGSETP